MNILWITNTILPASCEVLGIERPVLCGWIYSVVAEVGALENINLAVAAVYEGKKIKKFSTDGIMYYMLPSKSTLAYDRTLESLWKEVCEEFKPDVVHIHGTEYPAALACMRSCPELEYVISIQGLLSVIVKYYYADLTRWDILRSITFRDVVRRDSIFQAKRKFENRSVFEREYIQRTKHVIGRTMWDYVHTKAINPNVTYHFCNESLRDGFYTAGKWDVSRKKNHTIFLTQAYYPLKGAHQVLKAVALLKKDFPQLQVRLAGYDVVSNKTLKEKIRLSGYGNYLRHLIHDFDLKKHVRFLGLINEQQMISEYQNAHAFICSSSIENSPNSIGEAQIVGTPCVAAFVGGVPDMITYGQTGLLYRFEDTRMLAECIRRVFTNDELAIQLSLGGIQAATKRHDKRSNLEQMRMIYSDIHQGKRSDRLQTALDAY